MGEKLVVVLLLVAAFATPARADKKKFDIDGKLYTKYLAANNDSQGVLWLGNPFWPDDIAGNNGIATEFELVFKGDVSDRVKAAAKLKTRFGGMWQDWWESGERRSEYEGAVNTSGDSIGMNRAMYVKFRGFFVDIYPDTDLIDRVRVGNTDLGMFNEWTIGKARYIDRDNPMGVFVQGDLDVWEFTYHVAAIALPKLWVGPGWSTGIGDDKIDYPYYSQDWAYAARFDLRPGDLEWLKVRNIVTVTRDVEFDRWDPDAKGSVNADCVDKGGDEIPGCTLDHAVGTYPRYVSLNETFELEIEPEDDLISGFTPTYLHLLFGYSYAAMGEDFVANGVENNMGMFPVVYGDTQDFAGRARLFFADTEDQNFSLKLEGFYIGPEWNAIFGARREADVLLTDGFIEGGQLPTLNLANEFIDFDEPWVESCVGWMGATALAGYEDDSLDLKVEGTYINYATNGQGLDIKSTYPTFTYSEGFTDTDLYDYPNENDRGRDPRSVYKRDQDRQTIIAMTKGTWTFDNDVKVSAKAKYIRDDDLRKQRVDGKVFTDDDYLGNIYVGRASVSVPLSSSFVLDLGSQFDWWDEANRSSADGGSNYGDYTTLKAKGFAKLLYHYKGAKAGFYAEYIYKDQQRPESAGGDQMWNVWRSKATLEVAW